MRSARRGRPGLMGTVARTAVISGTARATANTVDRRQAERAAAAHNASAPANLPSPVHPVPPAPAAAPDEAGGDLVRQLTELGRLRTAGLLTDEEFTAAKASLIRTS